MIHGPENKANPKGKGVLGQAQTDGVQVQTWRTYRNIVRAGRLLRTAQGQVNPRDRWTLAAHAEL